jgi:hypothetical protein
MNSDIPRLDRREAQRAAVLAAGQALALEEVV